MENENNADMSGEIVVLGKTVKKSVLPEIYRLASANKKALEENIKSMMAAQGSPTPAALWRNWKATLKDSRGNSL